MIVDSGTTTVTLSVLSLVECDCDAVCELLPPPPVVVVRNVGAMGCKGGDTELPAVAPCARKMNAEVVMNTTPAAGVASPETLKEQRNTSTSVGKALCGMSDIPPYCATATLAERGSPPRRFISVEVEGGADDEEEVWEAYRSVTRERDAAAANISPTNNAHFVSRPPPVDPVNHSVAAADGVQTMAPLER